VTRVGRKIIDVPSGTSVSIVDSVVTVVGPKGSLVLQIESSISLEITETSVTVLNTEAKSEFAAKHGLYRSLIANMVKGVSEGYTQNLELVGVGYRVALQDGTLNFSLGYSHPVVFPSPEGIQFFVEGQTKIRISGIDKQVVGQTVAKIMGLRKRDAYKGKGIKLAGSVFKTKPGKSVKK
jgi:large subunit ribosomal protein L6